MGNDISTIGGAIATAGTAVAAGVTFGQVKELNNAVVDCANFTATKAERSVVRHVGETTAMAVATVGTSVAAGVTFGQVNELNNAVVGHLKGGILHACGKHERGDRALKSASRTVGVAAGGVSGFVAGGPVGAIAGGVAGGAAMDGVITGIARFTMSSNRMVKSRCGIKLPKRIMHMIALKVLLVG